MNIFKNFAALGENREDERRKKIIDGALILLTEEIENYLKCSEQMIQCMISIGENFKSAIFQSKNSSLDDSELIASRYINGVDVVGKSFIAFEASVKLKILEPLKSSVSSIAKKKTEKMILEKKVAKPQVKKMFWEHLNGRDDEKLQFDRCHNDYGYVRATEVNGNIQESIDESEIDIFAIMKNMHCLQAAFLEASAFGLLETCIEMSKDRLYSIDTPTVSLSPKFKSSESATIESTNILLSGNALNRLISNESLRNDQIFSKADMKAADDVWEGPINWQSHIPSLPRPASQQIIQTSCNTGKELQQSVRKLSESTNGMISISVGDGRNRSNTQNKDDLDSIDAISNISCIDQINSDISLTEKIDGEKLQEPALKIIAAAGPFLSVTDLCRCICVNKVWCLTLSKSVMLFRCCIRGPNAIPPHLRASFYVHVLYNRPEWLGRQHRKIRSRYKQELGDGVYRRLVLESNEVASTLFDNNGFYIEKCGSDSPEQPLATSFKIIEADLQRTRPALLLFRSKVCSDSSSIIHCIAENEHRKATNDMREKLRRVLRAFAIRSRRVSYCQGMNFVALALLEAAGGDEEIAFWALSGFSEKLSMEGVWSPGLHKLEFALFALDHMLEEYIPCLASHFKETGVTVGMFASKWFITLFQSHDTFGHSAALRILDFFVCERWPALLRIALMVLIEVSPQLLSYDFEGILHALRSPRRLLFGMEACDGSPEKAAFAATGCDSLCERIRADALLRKAHTLPFDVASLRNLEAEFYLGVAS